MPQRTEPTTRFYANLEAVILPTVLEARGLGKRYARNWIFRRVDFTLNQSEVLVVAGGNGTGKSTFVKCLVGLVSPSEGEVVRPPKAGMASVEQSLYHHLTAREHVRLFAALRHLPQECDSVLDRVGLHRDADRPVREYSTGMRARLKLALATLGRPELLVLDEPSAGLDSEGREIVREVIWAQREHGCTVLATNEAREVAYGDYELRLGD